MNASDPCIGTPASDLSSADLDDEGRSRSCSGSGPSSRSVRWPVDEDSPPPKIDLAGVQARPETTQPPPETNPERATFRVGLGPLLPARDACK